MKCPHCGKEIPKKSKKAETAPVILSLPLVDGSDYGITQADIDEWQRLFPAIEVMDWLKAIRKWHLNNPKKRKTLRGIRKHIVQWLEEEQNKGGGRFPRKDDPPPTAGKGVSYDTELERALARVGG